MINFLRKIRQKQLKGRYLKYAFGEILLVVVGILIALSINNWNDERKRQQNINSVLKEIQTDLQKDIDRASELLHRYVVKDSVFKLVINDQLTQDDYLNPANGGRLGVDFTYWYDDFKISETAYLKYKSLLGENSSKDDSLTNLLDEMFVPVKNNIDVYTERLRSIVYGNIDYLVKNKDWYYQWHSFSNQMIGTEYLDFFLNDDYYKNQAANYINDYLNLVSDAQTFRVQSLQASLMISERLREPGNTFRKQLFFEPEEAEKLTGEYRLKREGVSLYQPESLSVTYENQQLFLERGDNRIPLYRQNHDTFYSVDWYDVYRFISPIGIPAQKVIVISEIGNHEYFKANE